MTESNRVLLLEAIDRSLVIKILMRCRKIAQFNYHSQLKSYQIESALKDPRD